MPMGGVASVEFRGDLIFIGVGFFLGWMDVDQR
jgi:hypothetical protein